MARSITKSNVKKRRSTKYVACQQQLLQLFIERQPIKKYMEVLGVAEKTAEHWRNWLIEDQGDLVDKKLQRTKKKFVATTLAEAEFAKGIVVKSLKENKDDPRTVQGLTNALSGLQRTQMEAMTRFNIIAPEQVDHNVHFAGQGIEVIFLDENKQKVINVDAKVRNKEEGE